MELDQNPPNEISKKQDDFNNRKENQKRKNKDKKYNESLERSYDKV